MAIKAIQGRGRVVLSTVDTHNRLVDELLAMDRPAWIAPKHMPKRLDRKTVISIDPDAPLWEEMELGNVWVDLWGEKFAAAPAYVRDPAVRKGIKTILLQDRIAEERQRLQDEATHWRQWVEDEILTVGQALATEQGTYDHFRLSATLTQLPTS